MFGYSCFVYSINQNSFNLKILKIVLQKKKLKHSEHEEEGKKRDTKFDEILKIYLDDPSSSSLR